jgi:hypothetical protein
MPCLLRVTAWGWTLIQGRGGRIAADLSRIRCGLSFIEFVWRLKAVAAFCDCCGALITLKAEACPACGAPQHGMLLSDPPLPAEGDAEVNSEDDEQRSKNTH